MTRYSEQYASFVEAVSTFLAERSGRPLDEARIFVQKAVALQAWQHKLNRTFAERLRVEWDNLLFKTVFKARKRALRKVKRAEEDAQRQRTVDKALSLIGDKGAEDLLNLWNALRTANAERPAD